MFLQIEEWNFNNNITPLIPGLFIEFGARDGLYESNTHLFEKYAKWQGILIEANRYLSLLFSIYLSN